MSTTAEEQRDLLEAIRVARTAIEREHAPTGSTSG